MRKKAFILAFLLMVASVLLPAPAEAATFDVNFEMHSKGVLLANLDTDIVVFEKNADEPLEPASLTKIMTYIVAVENIDDLNVEITAPSSAIDALLGTGSSMAGIYRGETLTALQLLNCMMVPSGNEASMILADYVGGGSIPAFVEMMNQKAAELGCENTHFANPHGLHDASHVTTARDLYKIIKHAMTLPHFTEITSQTRYTIPPTNKSENARTLVTTNYMINKNSPRPEYYYQYAKGIKTGSHDEAGHCLASTAIKGGYTYLCIAMGSPSVDAEGNYIAENGAMIDSKALYEWAFDNLELKTIVSREQVMKEIKLELAWNKDTLLLTPGQEFSTIMPENVEASSVTITVDVPESITAPVQAGTVIGTATLSYANQYLGEIDLVASESVERSELLYYLQAAKNVVTSKWFIIGAVALVVLLVVYFIIAAVYNKRHRKRKVKKYRRF